MAGERESARAPRPRAPADAQRGARRVADELHGGEEARVAPVCADLARRLAASQLARPQPENDVVAAAEGEADCVAVVKPRGDRGGAERARESDRRREAHHLRRAGAVTPGEEAPLCL